jgi:hypothetical protein
MITPQIKESKESRLRLEHQALLGISSVGNLFVRGSILFCRFKWDRLTGDPGIIDAIDHENGEEELHVESHHRPRNRRMAKIVDELKNRTRELNAKGNPGKSPRDAIRFF